MPEIASRRHVENICAVVQQALEQAGESFESIDAVAVTYAPGLIGALLVGLNYAKGVALASGKPLIPVHHIRGHIAANYLTHPQLEPPFLCLVASGGHSHILLTHDYTHFEVIGRTRDDAAGERLTRQQGAGLSVSGRHLHRQGSPAGSARTLQAAKAKGERLGF